MKRMTPEQQQIAEESHKLIYEFLHQRGLDVDDWYDIAAIGFVKAVMSHNPARGKLSTVAFLRMQSEVNHEMAGRNRMMRRGISLSLSEPLNDDGGTVEDIIALPGDFAETAIAEVDAQMLWDSLCLTPAQRDTLVLRARGLTYREIGERLGGTASAHQFRITRIAEKARGLLARCPE